MISTFSRETDRPRERREESDRSRALGLASKSRRAGRRAGRLPPARRARAGRGASRRAGSRRNNGQRGFRVTYARQLCEMRSSGAFWVGSLGRRARARRLQRCRRRRRPLRPRPARRALLRRSPPPARPRRRRHLARRRRVFQLRRVNLPSCWKTCAGRRPHRDWRNWQPQRSARAAAKRAAPSSRYSPSLGVVISPARFLSLSLSASCPFISRAGHELAPSLSNERKRETRRAGQSALLAALFDTALAPGGVLLYSTCATSPIENDDVVTALFATRPEASALALELPPHTGAERTARGVALFPDRCHGAGPIFFAAIRKKPAAETAPIHHHHPSGCGEEATTQDSTRFESSAPASPSRDASHSPPE